MVIVLTCHQWLMMVNNTINHNSYRGQLQVIMPLLIIGNDCVNCNSGNLSNGQ